MPLIVFQGNDHIIFNGSFFYLNKEMEKIIRFPLPRGEPMSIEIPKNRVVQNSGEFFCLNYSLSAAFEYIFGVMIKL